MALFLHNPVSQAHLEDMRSRLAAQLVGRSGDLADSDRALVEGLVNVVQAMDRGVLTLGQALEAFAHDRLPGFSFGGWLVEMVDEGVYLETVHDEAA